MKRKDIKPCVLCGKGIMHDNNILFYQVTLTRLGVNLGAVQQRAGLEMMLGSPVLAEVMGPDEDLATKITTIQFLICDPCALERSLVLCHLHEIANEAKASKSGDE